MALHRDAVVGDRHSPYMWQHADATARNAETIAAVDLYKLALKLDDKTSWIAIATGSGADKWADISAPVLAVAMAYADTLVAAADAMVFKGVLDCSTNPNYPSADAGDTYRVSVAGKIGGASGVNVEVGDWFVCLADSTSAGDQATVGTSWSVFQTNLDGAVIGPASVTDGRPALFDGTTGKLLKQALWAITGPTVARAFAFPDADATVHTNLTKLDVLQAALIGGADSGAADAYAVAFTPAITALVTGAKYLFKAANANTGASTLNLQALGAQAIKKLAGGITTALEANDIRANQWVEVVWDGTNFQMMSPLGNAPSGGSGAAVNILTIQSFI